MKPFTSMTCTVGMLAAHVQAEDQSFCASDGQPGPVQLIERFVSADCDICASLRVIGWVENKKGQMVAAAQARCKLRR